MSNKYEILSLDDSDVWKSHLEKLPVEKQDIYYSSEYYKVYQNYGDGQALCFVYKEANKLALYPFFKNSVNQLGYQLEQAYFDIQGVYGYNGILTNSNDEEFKSNFFETFNDFCQKENIIAEFTRFNPLLNNFSFS